MGWLETFGQACRAAAEALGLIRARSELNNSAIMQANAAAKTREDIADKVNADIAAGNAGNLDQERKDAAE